MIGWGGRALGGRSGLTPHGWDPCPYKKGERSLSACTHQGRGRSIRIWLGWHLDLQPPTWEINAYYLSHPACGICYRNPRWMRHYGSTLIRNSPLPQGACNTFKKKRDLNPCIVILFVILTRERCWCGGKALRLWSWRGRCALAVCPLSATAPLCLPVTFCKG